MRVRVFLPEVALLLTCVASREAQAAPEKLEEQRVASDTQDRALAEALFQDGKRLGEVGRIAEACAKFEESQRVEPAPGTLLHLATCYEEDGRTASAWKALLTVAALAQRTNDNAREAFARRRAAELEQRLSRLVLSVAQPVPGMVIRVDTRTLKKGVPRTALPVDPGAHVIEVTAPGTRSWTRRIEVAPGPANMVVEVPPLEEAGAALSAPPARLSVLSPRSAMPAAEESHLRNEGIAVMGVGVLGLAFGSYFGIRAIGQTKEANQYCSGHTCTQQGLDGHAQANASAWLANIGFVAGVVGLAGGAYLTFATGRTKSGGQTALWIHGGPARIGLGGTF
jgi:hypothetical protein